MPRGRGDNIRCLSNKKGWAPTKMQRDIQMANTYANTKVKDYLGLSRQKLVLVTRKVCILLQPIMIGGSRCMEIILTSATGHHEGAPKEKKCTSFPPTEYLQPLPREHLSHFFLHHDVFIIFK